MLLSVHHAVSLVRGSVGQQRDAYIHETAPRPGQIKGLEINLALIVMCLTESKEITEKLTPRIFCVIVLQANK